VQFAEIRERALGLVEALDDRELETMLRRAARRFGTPVTIERVITPLLREIGDRWHRRELSPVHEHLATGVVERTLHWMFDGPTQDSAAPRLALATPQGERHEIGIQIAAAVAASETWRVVYLGADLPADAIAEAVRNAGARVLAMSVVSQAIADSALRQLATIRAALPDSIAMIVGGAGLAARADRLPAGVMLLEDLAALRAFLQSYRPARRS
jgi:methanogenic corrinoid protein MtbC1